MDNKASLLPNNRTHLEQATSQTLAQGYELNEGELIRSLYNAQTCPAHLLSYLAQAVAVDYWHYDWPEERKREVIHQALAIHRLKGTPQALLTALSNQGITATFREWWQGPNPDWWEPNYTTPETGTVVIQVLITQSEKNHFDQQKMQQLQQAVSYAKRESIQISIELGFRWHPILAISIARAPTKVQSDHQGSFTPLHPHAGITQLTVGGSSGRITLADFEFSGVTT